MSHRFTEGSPAPVPAASGPDHSFRSRLRAFGAALVAAPYRARLKRLGSRPRIFPPILISGGSRIEIGSSTRVEAFVALSAGPRGRMEIGSNCELSAFARLEADEGYIIVGDHSSVNSFSVVNGFGGVRIGRRVRIASHCVVLSSSHRFGDASVSIQEQGVEPKATTIEDDVWLGSHVVVVGGVSVGAHSVIGAGSVVIDDIPAFAVAAGATARVLRMRNV